MELKDWASLWTLKILSGLLVQIDVFCWYLDLPKGDHLPVLVLFSGADTGIAIYLSHMNHSKNIASLLRYTTGLCFRRQRWIKWETRGQFGTRVSNRKLKQDKEKGLIKKTRTKLATTQS